TARGDRLGGNLAVAVGIHGNKTPAHALVGIAERGEHVGAERLVGVLDGDRSFRHRDIALADVVALRLAADEHGNRQRTALGFRGGLLRRVAGVLCGLCLVLGSVGGISLGLRLGLGGLQLRVSLGEAGGGFFLGGLGLLEG